MNRRTVLKDTFTYSFEDGRGTVYRLESLVICDRDRPRWKQRLAGALVFALKRLDIDNETA